MRPFSSPLPNIYRPLPPHHLSFLPSLSKYTQTFFTTSSFFLPFLLLLCLFRLSSSLSPFFPSFFVFLPSNLFSDLPYSFLQFLLYVSSNVFLPPLHMLRLSSFSRPIYPSLLSPHLSAFHHFPFLPFFPPAAAFHFLAFLHPLRPSFPCFTPPFFS